MISTLFIQGEELEIQSSENDHTDLLLVKEYRIGAATRGDSEKIKIPIDKDNVVELEFDDDSVWLSDHISLEEIFPEGKLTLDDTTLEIPSFIVTEGAERGLFKNIALKILRLFTRKTVGEPVHKLAIKFEDALMDGKEGLVFINDDFSLDKRTVSESDKPYLLFLHGTAANTGKSFDKLVKTTDAPPVWPSIREVYGSDQIIGFQHRSLTMSPLENVRDLVSELPKTARLHLVSHSRGGLVGEILNRFCDGNGLGFSENELNYLKKNDRQNEVDLILDIRKIVKKKDIRVEKFIRVACGASGTILASNRLDHVLNIILNVGGFLIGIAAAPVFIAIKNLISAVVRTKSDAKILPGLEMQDPECPFLIMLNNKEPEALISTPLIIISGDAKGLENIKRALAILAAKLIFGKKDNDFIINTDAMYNGARRAENRVQFFFEAGREVSHFNYFKNTTTRKVLLDAIQHSGDGLIPGFNFRKQEFSSQEIRTAALKGLQYGALQAKPISGQQPIVVLLPGIMGSNLSVKDKSIWINYLQFLSGGLSRLEYSAENNPFVRATSLVKTSYEKLAIHLEREKYDVVPFPFDWRVSLTESAKALNDKLVELMKYNKPIKLIGHSMGGVLIRDFSIQHADTWAALNKLPGFRVLFLGSPLGGSYRIPYVLFGQDDIIKKLGSIDLTNTKQDLIKIFNNLPGLLCLLPFSKDADKDFSKLSTWKKMRDKFESKDWPLPSEAVLKEFGKYRDNVLNKISGVDFSNAVYVAGQNRPGYQTPCDHRFNDLNKLEFLATSKGDESVTWATGIPQTLLDKKLVYYSDITHGELANEKKLFSPIVEILETGKTETLKQIPPALRGGDRIVPVRRSYDFDNSAEGVERTLLGLGGEAERPSQSSVSINVSISHGDLKFSRFPVLVGHFLNDGIFSAERAIDGYLNGELNRRLQLGLYPGEIGTSKILIAEKAHQPSFKGAIIAGLGSPGNLSEFELSRTIEQAVTNYLTGFNSREVEIPASIQKSTVLGISALIIGCGYGGLSVEGSIRATLQGVQNANNKIRRTYESGSIIITEVEFVELLYDRALGCIHAINKIVNSEDKSLILRWTNRGIKRLPGARERMPVDNTSEWWTRITVRQLEEEKSVNANYKRGLRFNLSTGAAREEEREIYTGRETLMQLLTEMSTDDQYTPEHAKTMFELLIPPEFKDQVKRQNNINWIVDKHTAAYPWEMLQDSTAANARPISTNTAMIRQLATKDFRIIIKPVMDRTALVIGEPELEDKSLALPSAREEATRVSGLLANAGFIQPYPNMVGAKAADILKAIFTSEYKILHMSGHGIFSADPRQPTGMLIGKNAFLTTAEINQMSSVPELVFMNCCYLGAMDANAEKYSRDRYQLAANIGTQLIEIGVKAVIVAGWPVNDDAALEFAEEFYRNMLNGETFSRSVLNARKLIYENHESTNTWGAYQCYGDPLYKLRLDGKSKGGNEKFVVAYEAEIELNNLLNKIDTGDYASKDVISQVKSIMTRVTNQNMLTPRIAEREAMIYAGLNEYKLAVDKFKSLFGGTKADFTGQALEKYCSVRPKFYVSQFYENNAKAGKLLKELDAVIGDINNLLIYGTNAERLNLLASAYKRKAIMLDESKQGKQKAEAYLQSMATYQLAAEASDSSTRFYPLCNYYSIAYALVLSNYYSWTDEKIKVTKKQIVDDLLKELATTYESIKNNNDTDYWLLVAEANLKLCLYLLGEKKYNYESVADAYSNVWGYIGHLSNRRSEIEHLDFLDDLLSLHKPRSKASTAKTSLKQKLKKLRSELNAMNFK